jgi:hypothetical protein
VNGFRAIRGLGSHQHRRKSRFIDSIWVPLRFQAHRAMLAVRMIPFQEVARVYLHARLCGRHNHATTTVGVMQTTPHINCCKTLACQIPQPCSMTSTHSAMTDKGTSRAPSPTDSRAKQWSYPDSPPPSTSIILTTVRNHTNRYAATHINRHCLPCSQWHRRREIKRCILHRCGFASWNLQMRSQDKQESAHKDHETPYQPRVSGKIVWTLQTQHLARSNQTLSPP